MSALDYNAELSPDGNGSFLLKSVRVRLISIALA